jgi:hypothetical protein
MHALFPQEVRWLRRLWSLQHAEYARCSLLMIKFRITLCLTLINQVLQQSFYECQLKTSHGTTTSYVYCSLLLPFFFFFFDYYFWLRILHRYQRQDGSTSQRQSSAYSQDKTCSLLCRTTSAPTRSTHLAKSIASSNSPANTVETATRLRFDFDGNSVLVLPEWRKRRFY